MKNNSMKVALLIVALCAGSVLKADYDYIKTPKSSEKAEPLMRACRDNNIQMVKLLLSIDPAMYNPNLEDSSGNNSFDYAQDNQEILNILAPYKE